MHHSPLTDLVRLFGTAFIALGLVACMPESSSGDSGGGDNPPPSDSMSMGGAIDGEGGAPGQNMEEDVPGPLGDSCGVHRDCASGFCVAGLPGGYCTEACQTSEDCGAEGSCWEVGPARRLCLLNCEEDADCRVDEGYVCDGNKTCSPSAGGGGGGGGGPGVGAQAGAPVGDVMEDFSLTNCESGEQVSMKTFFEGKRAALFVLTAGWCGACSQWIPQVMGMMGQPQYEGLQAAFVLGENRSRSEPTQRECQQYGRNLGVPPENMFMDHNGMHSFRTVFGQLKLYTNAGGGFGLPWNGVVNPESWEYIYSDGGPGGDLNGAFRTLLQ